MKKILIFLTTLAIFLNCNNSLACTESVHIKNLEKIMESNKAKLDRVKVLSEKLSKNETILTSDSEDAGKNTRKYIAMSVEARRLLSAIIKDFKTYCTQNTQSLATDFPNVDLNNIFNLVDNALKALGNFDKELKLVVERVDSTPFAKFKMDPKDNVFENKTYDSILELISQFSNINSKVELVNTVTKVFKNLLHIVENAKSDLQDEFRTADYMKARNELLSAEIKLVKALESTFLNLINQLDDASFANLSVFAESNEEQAQAQEQVQATTETTEGIKLTRTSSSAPVVAGLAFIFSMGSLALILNKRRKAA